MLRNLVLPAVLLGFLVSGCAPGLVPGGVPSPDEIPGIESSLASSPDDADLRVRLGAAYLEAGRPADAVSTLSTLTARNHVAVFLTAAALEELEEWEASRELYERVRAESEQSHLVRSAEERIAWVRRQQLRADVAASLDREAELADVAPDDSALAIFPFIWEGGESEYSPLARAMAEMLLTDLGQVDELRVLERLQIQYLLDEIEMSESDRVDPATAVRSGRILGAGRVVQGRLGGDESELSVLAGLVGTGEGASLAEVSDADALQAFFDLQKRIAMGILSEMGIELSPSEEERVMARRTESLEALLLWGRALEAEDRGDFGEAAALYGEAADLDPGFDDARTRGVDIEQVERQAVVNPGSSALGVVGGLGGTPDLDDIRITYQPIEGLIPGPEGHDPGPELLGNEGIGSGPSILEIILRWP